MSDRNNTQVQLGCGTLIIIAIIVAIFSGDRDSSKLRGEVKELHEQIDRLERKIDAMSQKLDERAGTPASP